MNETRHGAGNAEREYECIEQRKRPPVRGIDLEQALNYVRAAPIGLEFFYRSFTQPVTFYQSGSRPALERFVEANVDADTPPAARLRQCVDAVARHVPHHVHFSDDMPADRALSEEQIIAQGRGWCNEQARLFVALAQVTGLPSRLVFARFHVICEAYVNGKWVTVDQSFGHVFQTSNGAPLNVLDIRREAKVTDDANTVYRARIGEVRRAIRDRLGPEAVNRKLFTKWASSERPIQILDSVGYCNYFVH